MADREKVRLVVGLISSADNLASALADLAAGNFTPDQTSLIARVDALDGAIGRLGSAAQAAYATWILCQAVDEPFPWRLTAMGPQGGGRAKAEREARALLGFHQWALRRNSRQLDLHLRAGGALLLVNTGSDSEERAACTALLRHAAAGVQTHEIADSLDR